MIPEVHITFQGGIGNQMFQYLFFNYMRNVSDMVYADISLYSKTKMHNGFILDKAFAVDLIFSNKENLLSNNKFIKKYFSLGFGKRKVISENTFIFEDLKRYHKIRFVGYWQTSYFVKDMYPDIRKLFHFNVELSAEAKSLLETIKNNNSSAIHIRKGDYIDKKNSDIFGLCSSSYYSNAIKLLNSKTSKKNHFLVFSDDIAYAKNLLNTDLNCTFIELNNEVEELYLMHKCKHQIIANSSFSWWGATLNDNENKVVVYPNPWYDKDIEGVFIPSDWNAISKY